MSKSEIAKAELRWWTMIEWALANQQARNMVLPDTEKIRAEAILQRRRADAELKRARRRKYGF